MRKIIIACALLLFVAVIYKMTLVSDATATSPNAGNWTDADVKKLCHFRWEGKPKRFDICLGRNNPKIGKPKQAGEAVELDKADKRLANIAAGRVKEIKPAAAPVVTQPPTQTKP